MLKAYLDQVVAGSNLSQTDAAAAMQVILDGQATEAQIGAFPDSTEDKRGKSRGDCRFCPDFDWPGRSGPAQPSGHLQLRHRW